METHTPEEREFLERLKKGERGVVGDLFVKYEDRLRRMVRLRMDRRLHGRVDSSDVIQESFLEVLRRMDAYLKEPNMPLFLWVRFITGQKLQEMHRKHLRVQMRDAGKEVSIFRGSLPLASSVMLAAQLLGKLSTPSEAAARVERQVKVQEALNLMSPLDREILALRHFEELTNNEAAEVLGLSKAAACNRYIRALKRLRKVLVVDPR